MHTYGGSGAHVYWLTVPAPREPARQRIERVVNAAVDRRRRAVAAHRCAWSTRVPIFTPRDVYRDAMSVGGASDDRPRVGRHPPERRRIVGARDGRPGGAGARLPILSAVLEQALQFLSSSLPVLARSALASYVGHLTALSVRADKEGAFLAVEARRVRRVSRAGRRPRRRRRDPPRDPGAARARRDARRPLPRVAVGGPRRLRRRRRLLRDVRLPHHHAAPARARPRPGASRWPRSGRGAPAGCCPPRSSCCSSASRPRCSSSRSRTGRSTSPTCARARSTCRTGTSPRRRSTTSPPPTPLAGAALLVAVGRGAVLRPVAAGHPDRRRASAAHRAPATIRQTVARCSSRSRWRASSTSIAEDLRRSGRGLFRDARPRLGVRRRRAARVPGQQRASARRRCAPLLSWTGLAAIAARASTYDSTDAASRDRAAMLPVLARARRHLRGACRASAGRRSRVLRDPPGAVPRRRVVLGLPVALAAARVRAVRAASTRRSMRARASRSSSVTIAAASLTKVLVEDPLRHGAIPAVPPLGVDVRVQLPRRCALVLGASAQGASRVRGADALRTRAIAAARRRAHPAAASVRPRATRAKPCRNDRPATRGGTEPDPRPAGVPILAPCTVAGQPRRASSASTPGEAVRAPIALVGDSHAGHWRAAARQDRSAQTLAGHQPHDAPAASSRPVPRRCPSRGAPGAGAGRPEVLSWFARHPHVDTVFVVADRGQRRRRRRAAMIGSQRPSRASSGCLARASRVGAPHRRHPRHPTRAREHRGVRAARDRAPAGRWCGVLGTPAHRALSRPGGGRRAAAALRPRPLGRPHAVHLWRCPVLARRRRRARLLRRESPDTHVRPLARAFPRARTRPGRPSRGKWRTPGGGRPAHDDGSRGWMPPRRSSGHDRPEGRGHHRHQAGPRSSAAKSRATGPRVGAGVMEPGQPRAREVPPR